MESYISAQTLAKMLGISPETPRIWRQRKQGPPYVKLGGRCVRYGVSDVEAWVKSLGKVVSK